MKIFSFGKHFWSQNKIICFLGDSFKNKCQPFKEESFLGRGFWVCLLFLKINNRFSTEISVLREKPFLIQTMFGRKMFSQLCSPGLLFAVAKALLPHLGPELSVELSGTEIPRENPNFQGKTRISTAAPPSASPGAAPHANARPGLGRGGEEGKIAKARFIDPQSRLMAQ